MAIIRVEKIRNYSVMSNYHLKEKKLSLKAKGLMSVMLSLPDDWDYSVDGLVSILKEGYDSVKTALDELKQFGYLEVIRHNPDETDSGRLEYEYIVHEQSIFDTEQGPGKQVLEDQGLEDRPQLNTNKQNTKHTDLATLDRGSRRSLVSTPRTKSLSIKRTNRFITMCERQMQKHDIRNPYLVSELQKFFIMLGESGTLLPETTISAQLDALLSLADSKQAAAVKQTVEHGWKSLTYAVDELKAGNKPKFDTAVESTFHAKTEEEKIRNPIVEGEEVF